eukprot:744938-Rhodomonas_salina.1
MCTGAGYPVLKRRKFCTSTSCAHFDAGPPHVPLEPELDPPPTIGAEQGCCHLHAQGPAALS